MKEYILVIDAGTGSVRSILFDTSGNQIALSQQEWTHKNIPEYTGSMEFETQKNWQIIKSLIANSIKKAGISASQIKGISSTSMREGIVVYDRENKELWACANVDSRAYNEVIQLKTSNSELEKEVYKITGQTFALSAIPRLLWLRKNEPDIFKKIGNFSMLSDWILFKLTGKIFVEPSNGSTSGLISLNTRSWATNVIEKCGLPTDIYPEIVESGTVIGKVSAEAAQETGLSKNTSVIMGGGDAQLGCLGLGSVKNGDAVVLGGSFWQQEVNINKPIFHKDAKIRVNCHAIPSLWQLEGISFFSGLIMRWFRDAFFSEEKKIAENLHVDPYMIITEKVENIPIGSFGVVPIFSDIMNFIHWKHAGPSFLNIPIDDPERSNKYTFFRSLMENAGFVAYGNLKEIEKTIGYFPEKIVFAGGSSKNPYFASMLADIFNTKILVPKIKEATALGAAILSALGIRIFSNLEEAVNNTVKFEASFYPDSARHMEYMEYYEKWKNLYREIYKLTEKGMLNPMWASPGT